MTLAEAIAMALGGRKVGVSWMARCPAHDDHEPSLSIRDGGDGKMLIRCHAGSDQRQVIGPLRTRGLWGQDKSRWCRCPARRAVATERPDSNDATRTEAAVTIWQAALPGGGTVVAAHLMSRSASCAAVDAPLPSWAEAPLGRRLARDGRAGDASDRRRAAGDPPHVPCPRRAGKAPVNPSKMMLGPKLPRMADFALWATVCETALWPAGMFWTAYGGNRDEAVEGVIDADRQGSSRRV